MSLRLPLLLAAVLPLAALPFAVGCGSPGGSHGGGSGGRATRFESGSSGSSSGGALMVHPVYQTAFDAVKVALDQEELGVADATLRRLRGRLLAEREVLPTVAEAKANQGDLSYQVLSGELPARENVEAALRMVDGFGKVIEGRKRMGAIELEVQMKRIEGEEAVRVSLVGRSTWDRPLTLHPGPVTVDLRRTSLEPMAGLERQDAAQEVLADSLSLEIPAMGDVSLVLTELPIEVPVGAIATRMRVSLRFIGGTLEEGDDSYPARDIAAQPAVRTDLAGWVPATLVDPGDLVELVRRGNAPLAAVLERTVRIAPPRYDETLDRLGAVVETQPAEALRTLLPALRWLTGATQFGRDELAWRNWLLKRLEERRESGLAFGG